LRAAKTQQMSHAIVILGIPIPLEPVRNFLGSAESVVILSPRARDSQGAVMWTTRNRARYERKGLRYESDLTDEEYALIEPLLPPERSISRRSLINGILYVLTTGCQWRQLPKDFPPKSTTHDYFVELQCTGVLTRIHHALYAEVRVLEGRAATPTLAVVDSQTVKSAEKGGRRLIRLDMTRARKSRAKSATRPSIRSAS
jgi:transposase